MAHYIAHFSCNASAWPSDHDDEMAIWKEMVGEATDLASSGGPVKFAGWTSNTEGFALLEAESKAEVIRLCARFWPMFTNDIREVVPIAEAGPAILAGTAEGWKR